VLAAAAILAGGTGVAPSAAAGGEQGWERGERCESEDGEEGDGFHGRCFTGGRKKIEIFVDGCHTYSYFRDMPNKRGKNIKRTTITVDDDLHKWAMEEAERLGVNDFSTFVRILIAAEKEAKRVKPDSKS